MDSFDSRPLKGHDGSARPRTEAPEGSPRDAARVFLTAEQNPSADSRRIALGLTVLALLSVVLLNFGIYQGARSNLQKQRWADLEAQTDSKREEVRGFLWEIQRHAEFVSAQSHIVGWAVRGAAGDLDESSRLALVQEFRKASLTLHFENVALVTPDRACLADGGADGAGAGPADFDLGARAVSSRRTLVDDGDILRGRGVLRIGVPVGPPGAPPVAALIFRSRIDEALEPILAAWPGFGPTAGAYLVRRTDRGLVCITTPPPAIGGAVGEALTVGTPLARPADIAAESIESTIDAVDASGRPLWVVTRGLPEFGWGLVGQVDPRAMMEGLHGTVAGLLALDSAMLLLGLAGVWFWRRQYQTGLARREIEVSRRHASRVQAIFDTAFDAILTFDRTGRIVTVNRAAERLFQRAAVELETQPIHRVLRWDAEQADPNTGLPARGVVSRGHVVAAQGETPVEFSLGTAGEGGELVYTAIVRDIRERVENEARIRTFAEGLESSNRRLEEVNAQLEEASRLKSEFLANTSHELRTPLNGMIGFLQLVLDGLCDSPDEERDFLQQALACSRHLLGLINDVLDIAKIESGKISLEIASVDLRALFDEVHTVTHVQAQQRGLELRFEPPDDPDIRARGDFGKVKQILINLIGNSLKFTHQGSITLRATARPDTGHVMLEVRDTGIGIDPSRQRVIFEKFTQADGSTTRKYGGTGLGLAISKSLVELMGGVIGVESRGEGQGTRMYFSLPLWREEEGASPAGTEAAGRVEGPEDSPLVLVVEDDPVFRHYLRSLLHVNGYRTAEAAHADGGWALALELRPSLVLLDYALACPEGATVRTGWELAERLAGADETRHVPVVFVTGFEDELHARVRDSLFSRRPTHLVKPIEGPQLIRRMDEVLGSTPGVVRVLLADDDPLVAAYVRRTLPAARFDLDTAANGEECLRKLRSRAGAYDLLVLDLMMPEVSGYDVLRELTLTGIARELPVLVLTNVTDGWSEDERRLLEQGAVLDVLPKSDVHERPALLPHVIERHLRRAQGARPDDDAPEREARAA